MPAIASPQGRRDETVQVPGIRRTVSRILAMVFCLGLLAGLGGFYLLLQDRALGQAASEARILLRSALAIRGYTAEHIFPKLARLEDGAFHAETVPSFAAQTVFRMVASEYSAYTYREPALNPTSSADLATPFEVELIQRFRADPRLAELSGVRPTDTDRLFYLARPIRITQEGCLTCHSTPERAPPAMLAKYGTGSGFGWQMNEVVGAQVLTVPVTQGLKGSLELVGVLGLGLALIFGLAYVALVLALDRMVIRPLGALSRAAEAASQSGDPRLGLPRAGAGEIRRLAESIDRLRISLGKAMGLLGRGAAPRPEAGD
ncbi:Tll0287-like domain-containing protein [Teichococcus aestuarii]|uniref:Tll0287-like domain-containing protein n=1 Tax=Teichococcus aestuarii TaxID=568898 RepID=UPI00361B9E66